VGVSILLEGLPAAITGVASSNRNGGSAVPGDVGTLDGMRGHPGMSECTDTAPSR
jgi:hypothetical protein